MIGQINLLKQIDKLIEENKFPRFSIVTGQKGQGKTELILQISQKLRISFINFGTGIDEIRQMIELAYKQVNPVIFVINNADNMSLNAQNSLLKLVEEPPNNCFIVLELNDINNTLETIRSRCQEFKMENYTKEELIQFINKDYFKLSVENKNILLDICQNKYQISLMIEYGVQEFYQFVEKVVDNIYKVQSANAFKLEEKLDIKGDGNGYDLDLFFNTFHQICMNRLLQIVDVDNNKEDLCTKYANSIEITAKYKNKLNIRGINRQAILDSWILSVRKIWR